MVSAPNKTSQDVSQFTSTGVVKHEVMATGAAKCTNPLISVPSQRHEATEARRFVLPKLVHPEQEASSGKSKFSLFGEKYQETDVQDRLDSIHEVYSGL